MARKSFAVEQQPHVAEVGGTELHFLPEMYGDKYLDAYAELQTAQAALGAEGGDHSKLSGEKLRELYGAIRSYLTQVMTEESAERFSRFEVCREGQVVEVFRSLNQADTYASGLEGAVRVVDRSMQVPDRVLLELMEWTIELYGGGQDRPTGRSKGSSAGSRRTSTSGRASSRSKA